VTLATDTHDASSPASTMRRVGWRAAAFVGAGSIAALVVGGVPGALACLVGGVATGLSLFLLARGLSVILGASTSQGAGPALPPGGGASMSPARGSARAIVSFTFRHAALAAILLLATWARLPAPWIVAGVTAWPLALSLEAVSFLRTPFQTTT
jgi:hypothetical protein